MMSMVDVEVATMHVIGINVQFVCHQHGEESAAFYYLLQWYDISNPIISDAMYLGSAA